MEIYSFINWCLYVCSHDTLLAAEHLSAILRIFSFFLSLNDDLIVAGYRILSIHKSTYFKIKYGDIILIFTKN